ncbi:MAG: hypothetical protein K8L91_09940 [Anaerolineae bacterium]|nr:hypothetical protein [Anaerolineae bacterium]
MSDALRFAYRPVQDSLGRQALRPLMPILLNYGVNSREAIGLLDTGADVNVLPYQMGLSLGAVWEEQATAVELSGNLANHEARGIILTAVVGDFAPVDLAFAWTMAPNTPLILGQTNFFTEFDVCFFRTQRAFEVRQKLDFSTGPA